jgi:hypothetical protein
MWMRIFLLVQLEHYEALVTAWLQFRIRSAARQPDENHAASLKHGLILVTCDRDYLNESLFPLIHCPAIVVFDFGSGSLKEIREAFTCLERILASSQSFDKWVKIDAKRDSWTEYSRCLERRWIPPHSGAHD